MTTTVNIKGQVTIPKALWRKHGFAPGTKVVWIERDGELIPRPVQSIGGLYGSLRSTPGQPSLADVLLEERRLEHERENA